MVAAVNELHSTLNKCTAQRCTPRRLAGSLDYVGHIDKGLTTAEEVLQMSRALFGIKHPVVALCLTTAG